MKHPMNVIDVMHGTMLPDHGELYKTLLEISERQLSE